MTSFKQLTILTKRIIKQNLSDADTIITVIGMPIFLLLFFVYVMGGNIVTGDTVHPSVSAYLDYALPGFLLLTMAMGSAYTALQINSDQTSGFLNRLHSLPIKRWVILGSHVLASVIFMLVADVAVFIVATIMGYRVNSNVNQLINFIGLALLFAFAITLLAIPFSLKAKNYASAGGFSYILLMLLFVSSALMPVKGMAKPVRLFAENQPMTSIVNVGRSFLNASYSVETNTILVSLSWLLGLVIIFGTLSYIVYKKVYVQR